MGGGGGGQALVKNLEDYNLWSAVRDKSERSPSPHVNIDLVVAESGKIVSWKQMMYHEERETKMEKCHEKKRKRICIVFA